jgi:hypothetical protein
MGLWNTLHHLVREKLAGRRGAGKKGRRPHSRLEVERLDQRLLPSSFQWGMSQGLPALAQPGNPGQAPTYDMGKHATEAPIQVSSFSFGATNTAATQPLTINFADVIVSQTPHATAPISFNFVPPLKYIFMD